MGYEGFWGMTALALILLGHGLFVVRKETKGKELVEIPSNVKKFFGALGGLCLAAFIAGVVMILCNVETETVHVAGVIMLALGLALNNQLRKFAPLLAKKEEQEEEIDE